MSLINEPSVPIGEADPAGVPDRGGLKTWLEAALGFLYPPACQVCGLERATVAGGYVCGCCRGKVRWIRPPFCERCGLPYEGEITTRFECSNCNKVTLHFTSARSAVVARGMVLDIIHRYKYHRAVWFEPFLAGLLVREAKPALEAARWDLVVPVPLHATRKREREFNQAEAIGAHLSHALGIPLEPGLIARVEPTKTQTMLSREARAENVRSAFALRKGVRLEGRKVVLVDDVLTTGATTNACARLLKKAGADEVCVWTVARGI